MKLKIQFKQIQYVLLILNPCILFALKVNAQKKATSFSEVWKIDYGLVFKSVDPQSKADQDDEGTILRCYLSKDKFRIEEKGDSSSIVVYKKPGINYYSLDTNRKVAYRLAIQRFKVDVKMSADSMIVIGTDKFKLRLSEDTATVAGYVCKKAIFTIDSFPVNEITVWYSPQIPQMFWGKYTYLQSLAGCALSISADDQNSRIIIDATAVGKLSVPNSLFSVPAEYKKLDAH